MNNKRIIILAIFAGIQYSSFQKLCAMKAALSAKVISHESPASKLNGLSVDLAVILELINCLPDPAKEVLVQTLTPPKDSLEDIHRAAKGNDRNKLELLLQSDPTLKELRSRKGKTPLHFAAAEGRDEALNFLLDQHADIEARTNRLMTPLIIAAANGRKGVVKILIAKKAILDATDIEGRSALWYAIHKNHGHTAKLLREKGALVIVQIPSITGEKALITQHIQHYIAPRNGHTNFDTIVNEAKRLMGLFRNSTWAMVILESISQLEQVKPCHPLLRAVLLGIDGVLDFWIKDYLRGLSEEEKVKIINDQSFKWTPLLAATANNSVTTLVLLLAAGADPNQPNEDGKTCLMIAAKNPYPNTQAVIEKLLAAGAKTDRVDRENFTALHHGADCENSNAVAILAPLTKNIDQEDALNGRTALLTAIFRSNPELVHLLLNAGANPNVSTSTKVTALKLLVLNASPEGPGNLNQERLHQLSQGQEMNILKLITLTKEKLKLDSTEIYRLLRECTQIPFKPTNEDIRECLALAKAFGFSDLLDQLK